MFQHKENEFVDKFKLLSTPENSEDINWSSSSSSDYEELNRCEPNRTFTKKPNRKRKRRKNANKNISNLDITVIDVPVNVSGNKSPIFGTNHLKIEKVTSPVLTCKTLNLSRKSLLETSPILSRPITRCPSPVLTQTTPTVRRKIRKQLFDINDEKIPKIAENYINTSENGITSPVLETRVTKTPRSCKKTKILNQHESSMIIKTEPHIIETTQEDSSDELSDSLKLTLLNCNDLDKKFFNNQFSSESISQHTIVNSLTTQEDSKSDDIDIINTLTQINSTKSFQNITKPEVVMERKIKYKKDGLAYKLNSLLKKQSSSLSLWNHEKFLAKNSNFLVPNEKFIVFNVIKSEFKYGSLLLYVMDSKDNKYMVLINNCYLDNSKVSEKCIFKLYEPYSLIDWNRDVQLYFNVSKFEFVETDL